MKRFVWLVLFAFCTALAQVQPVDVPAKKPDVCDCCAQPGDCAKPACALPVTGQAAFVAETPTGQRAEARRLVPATAAKRENFYAKFASRPAVMPAGPMRRVAVATASEPLFRVHCSYLI